MGQRIELRGATAIGDVAYFDTDRTISGQDGDAFASAEEAAAVENFSAQLATRVFAADKAISSVFVQSTQGVVGRNGFGQGAHLSIINKNVDIQSYC